MKILFKDRFIEPNYRTLVMGIHNATPDSFSDGGCYPETEASVSHCVRMIEEGADIIDIGGESTRPGATQVSIGEELRRILPVIKGLKKVRPGCVISVDTIKAEVAEEAVKSGADIINDVSGLKYSSNMAAVAAKYGAGLVLMHMHGEPESGICNYTYNNIVEDICSELRRIADKALSSGVKKESIIIDPGLGGGTFGKKKEQSLKLLANIRELKKLGFPVLVGASRKGFIGEIIGEEIPSNRLFGSLGAAAWAVAENVDIVRVHDVRETVQLVKVFETVRRYS